MTLNKKETKIEIYPLSGGTVSFTGDYMRAVFAQEILPLNYPPAWKNNDVSKNWDTHNEYKLNSYRYRGPEFTENVDILAAGCSFTYGIGVPEEGTWPAILAKNLNMSYVNVSAPGASIEWITTSIYRYINTFGKPKMLVVLLPDLIRGEISVDGVNSVSEEVGTQDFVQQYWDNEEKQGVVTHQKLEAASDVPRLIKKPYPIESTESEAESIRNSIRELRVLESYCKAAEIPLVWSSWADDVAHMMDFFDDHHINSFDNFMHLDGIRFWKSHKIELLPKTEDDPDGIIDYKLEHEKLHKTSGCTANSEEENCTCYSNCHYDLLPKFGDSFHMGTDRWREGNEGNAHPGVHKYIHMAGDYERKLKEAYGIQRQV